MLKKKKEAVASEMSLLATHLLLIIVNIICEIIISQRSVKSIESNYLFHT